MKLLLKIILPLLLLIVNSCSDKYKSVYGSAPISVLRFNYDTLRIREKDPFNITPWSNSVLWIHSVPSLKVMNIQFNDPSGKVHFIYRDEPMADSRPIIAAGDSTSLFCRCDTAGYYPVDFYLLDQLEKVSTKQLIVHCLGNDKAKADLQVVFVDSSTVDNWNYRFDGSNTLKKYGLINDYYFAVNGQPFYSTLPVVNWVFHARGEQKVSLYVVDDLGLHSDTVTQKIIIP